MTTPTTAPAGPGLVLVTGGSGTTGRRLVALLNERGAVVRSAQRSGTPPAGASSVCFDWFDASTHAAALEGVKRMYLIPPTGADDPASAMTPFVDLARATGVERAVLHSSAVTKPGDPGVGRVHQHIASTFHQWAVLRPNWFMQNVTGKHPIARMIRETGTIVTATGAARVGFVDVGDIARAGAAILLSDTAPNADFVLTGPQALSYDDVAATLSRVAGRPITHENVSAHDLPDRYRAIGVSDSQARFLAVMDGIISSGGGDRVTDAVRELTGAAPRSFEAFAKAEFVVAPTGEDAEDG